MTNAKRKGNSGEHAFARFLESHGLSAHRNTMSGGSIWKGDIGNSFNATIEVKTVKKINLQEAWRQVAKDSAVARNMPLLAIRFDRMPEGEWLIVTHSEDWIDLLLKEKSDVKTNKEKSWIVKKAIDSLKSALKELEG